MTTTRALRSDQLDDILELYGMRYPEPQERTAAVESDWDAIQKDGSTTVLGVEHDGRAVSTCQLPIVRASPTAVVPSASSNTW